MNPLKPLKLVATNLAIIESDFASCDKDDRIYFDTEIAGFGIRFRSGGTRTWILQYKFEGSDKRLTLGPYPGITPKAARSLAQDKLASIWKGVDPQQAKRDARTKAQALITLGAVIDNYLITKQTKLRPSSLSDARRYLLVRWKPLHGLPISDISRQQIANILDKLEQTGSVAAARARANLSTLFKWAMGHGYVDHNPVIGTINPDPRIARERVLSDDELLAIWHACGDDDFGTIVKLLTLTGQRRSEVGAMAWSEFNDGIWTIPSARTKNKKAHVLPLPQACWSIINSVKHRDGIDYLFGNNNNQGYRSWSLSKQLLDKRCGLSDWTLHDLRRTFRTGLGKLGIAPHIAELVINHRKGGVEAVYDRYRYEPEIAAALTMWTEHVRSIIEGTEPTVVPLRKGISGIPA
jgi:integrase